MFDVEYRTIGQNGRVHPSSVASVGAHKAQSKAEAAAYVVAKFGRVEVLSVEYVGAL